MEETTAAPRAVRARGKVRRGEFAGKLCPGEPGGNSADPEFSGCFFPAVGYRMFPMKLLRLTPCLGLAASLVSAYFSLTANVAAAPAARVSLFDGKSLTGWSVLKCEAEVQAGQIFIKAGNGLVQTQKKYGDFVLELEWKALKAEKWDSGIYFRYDTVPANKAWPPRYQVNFKQVDEGNVGGLKGAVSKGLFKDHEWNKLKFTVRGTKAKLEVNGQPAWEADGLEGPKEGFIALQSEVPGGGQHLFRNIFITEL